ncbi:hypothetical protein [Burkholderia sp. Ac-20365]|uniref:hypothetical protein n=1 Tax=Burkholderia sp. Ac-20365 TaxID=2703897 RepID=UPI00197BA3B9|nr:hypothetical protein [Burkholderia sp. Ac-20365]MBN3762440.1 hypothetical protein [Burkholderia sp. Ac-20365]
MVSSVGYGTASAPSTHRASVSGDASAQTAQSTDVSAASAVRNDTKQDAATKAAQPGVTVSISPEGAAAASRAQQAERVNQADPDTAVASTGTDTDSPASTDTTTETDEAANGTDGSTANVSPVKAFAYGALGLERPDQPRDEQNAFYTAGKWLAAGLTVGGLISLLA